MRFRIVLSAASLMLASQIAFAQAPTPSPTPMTSAPPMVAPSAVTPPPMPAVNPVPTPAPTPQAYTIAYKYVPGEDLKYAADMKVSGGVANVPEIKSVKAKLSFSYDSIVKSVDTAGNGVLTTKPGPYTISLILNGNPMPIPSPTPGAMDQVNKATVTMSPRGSFVAMDPGDTAAKADPNSKMVTAMIAGMVSDLTLLPDHPVAVGDSWRGGLNLAQYGVVISMKMTLNSVTQVAGVNDANVGVKLLVTVDPKVPPPGKGLPGMEGTPAHPMHHAMHIAPSDIPKGTISILGQGALDFDLDDGYPTSTAMSLQTTIKTKAMPGNEAFAVPHSATILTDVNTTLSKATIPSPTTAPTPVPST